MDMKATPVAERLYELAAKPAQMPNGMQRRIVLSILESNNRPMSVAEIAQQATTMGLVAVGGVTASVTYHLHQMKLVGQVVVLNPLVARAASKPAEVVIDFGTNTVAEHAN